VQASAQRNDRNDELGGISKGCIQQPANAFTDALGDLLRCAPH
jgi:hypothetical protein